MGTPPHSPWDQSGEQDPGQQDPGQQYPGQQYPGPYGQAGQPYPGTYGQQPPGQYAQQPGRYASWGKRFVAVILDSLLLMPIVFVGTFVVGATSDSSGELSAAGVIVLVVTILAAWGFQFWNRCIRAGRTGQSLGRQWMGIWLLEESSGRPVGTVPAFARELLHFLDSLCYIGYILAAFDPKTQTFADKIMKTVVVSR